MSAHHERRIRRRIIANGGTMPPFPLKEPRQPRRQRNPKVWATNGDFDRKGTNRRRKLALASKRRNRP